MRIGGDIASIGPSMEVEKFRHQLLTRSLEPSSCAIMDACYGSLFVGQ
jgi:hypothetical protein